MDQGQNTTAQHVGASPQQAHSPELHVPVGAVGERRDFSFGFGGLAGRSAVCIGVCAARPTARVTDMASTTVSTLNHQGC